MANKREKSGVAATNLFISNKLFASVFNVFKVCEKIANGIKENKMI
jgi:hypothetical protein